MDANDAEAAARARVDAELAERVAQQTERDHWMRQCNGDEYGAVLALTAHRARQMARDAADAARAGSMTRSAMLLRRDVSRAARDDLIQYFGPTIDQCSGFIRQLATDY